MTYYRCEVADCFRPAKEYRSKLTGLSFFLCVAHKLKYEFEKKIELEDVIE